MKQDFELISGHCRIASYGVKVKLVYRVDWASQKKLQSHHHHTLNTVHLEDNRGHSNHFGLFTNDALSLS